MSSTTPTVPPKLVWFYRNDDDDDDAACSGGALHQQQHHQQPTHRGLWWPALYYPSHTVALAAAHQQQYPKHHHHPPTAGVRFESQKATLCLGLLREQCSGGAIQQPVVQLILGGKTTAAAAAAPPLTDHKPAAAASMATGSEPAVAAAAAVDLRSVAPHHWLEHDFYRGLMRHASSQPQNQKPEDDPFTSVWPSVMRWLEVHHHQQQGNRSTNSNTAAATTTTDGAPAPLQQPPTMTISTTTKNNPSNTNNNTSKINTNHRQLNDTATAAASTPPTCATAQLPSSHRGGGDSRSRSPSLTTDCHFQQQQPPVRAQNLAATAFGNTNSNVRSSNSRSNKRVPNNNQGDPTTKENTTNSNNRQTTRTTPDYSIAATTSTSTPSSSNDDDASWQHHLSIGRHDSWTRVWQLLVQTGWTSRGDEDCLDRTYYVKPYRSVDAGIEGVDYFTRRTDVQDCVRHWHPHWQPLPQPAFQPQPHAKSRNNTTHKNPSVGPSQRITLSTRKQQQQLHQKQHPTEHESNEEASDAEDSSSEKYMVDSISAESDMPLEDDASVEETIHRKKPKVVRTEKKVSVQRKEQKYKSPQTTMHAKKTARRKKSGQVHWWKSENMPVFTKVWPILKTLGFRRKDKHRYVLPDNLPGSQGRREITLGQSALRKFLCRHGIPNYETKRSLLQDTERALLYRWVAFANVPVLSHNSAKTLRDISSPKKSNNILNWLYQSGFSTVDGKVYKPHYKLMGTTNGATSSLKHGEHYFDLDNELNTELRAYVRGAWRLGPMCVNQATNMFDLLQNPLQRMTSKQRQTHLGLRLWAAASSQPLPVFRELPDAASMAPYEVMEEDCLDSVESASNHEQSGKTARNSEANETADSKSFHTKISEIQKDDALGKAKRRDTKHDKTESKNKVDDTAVPESFNAKICDILPKIGFSPTASGRYILPTDLPNSKEGEETSLELSALRKFFCRYGIPNYVASNSILQRKERECLLGWVTSANVPDTETKMDYHSPKKADNILGLLFLNGFSTVDGKIFKPNYKLMDRKDSTSLYKHLEHFFYLESDLDTALRVYVRGAWRLGPMSVNSETSMEDLLENPLKNMTNKQFEAHLSLRLWAAASLKPIPDFQELPNSNTMAPFLAMAAVHDNERKPTDGFGRMSSAISGRKESDVSSLRMEPPLPFDRSSDSDSEDDVGNGNDVDNDDDDVEDDEDGKDSESDGDDNVNDDDDNFWYKKACIPDFGKDIWSLLVKLGFEFRSGLYCHKLVLEPIGSSTDVQKFCAKNGIPNLETIDLSPSERRRIHRWAAFANVDVKRSVFVTTMKTVKQIAAPEILSLLTKLNFQFRDQNCCAPSGADQPGPQLDDVRDFIRGTVDLSAGSLAGVSNRRYKCPISEDQILSLRLWAALSPSPLPIFQPPVKPTENINVSSIADSNLLILSQEETLPVLENNLQAVTLASSIPSPTSSPIIRSTTPLESVDYHKCDTPASSAKEKPGNPIDFSNFINGPQMQSKVYDVSVLTSGHRADSSTSAAASSSAEEIFMTDKTTNNNDQVDVAQSPLKPSSSAFMVTDIVVLQQDSFDTDSIPLTRDDVQSTTDRLQSFLIPISIGEQFQMSGLQVLPSPLKRRKSPSSTKPSALRATGSPSDSTDLTDSERQLTMSVGSSPKSGSSEGRREKTARSGRRSLKRTKVRHSADVQNCSLQQYTIGDEEIDEEPQNPLGTQLEPKDEIDRIYDSDVFFSDCADNVVGPDIEQLSDRLLVTQLDPEDCESCTRPPPGHTSEPFFSTQLDPDE